jgi:DNA repair protein RecN (Recombination protein N)
VLATLASLRIRNLALVEDLVWQPGCGLVAITGETGAGKSLLIGALQLLLGERADKSLIRAGADACTVEAAFELADSKQLDAWLEEQGTEPCSDGQLLLKRSLPVEGSGRQFINGSPCTLTVLKALGDSLVDLHGPHDHQSLFSREAQTRVLDAYAGAAVMAGDFAAAHRETKRLAAEIEHLRALEQDAALRGEMLAHAAREIAEAKLLPGEEEEVVSRLRAAGNSQRLLELSSQLMAALGAEGEGGLRQPLAEAVRAARELARLDESAAALSEALGDVAVRVADLERDVQSYAEKIDSDPGSLRALEARADLLQSLQRKYGGTIEEVVARGAQAAQDLEDLERRGEKIAALEKDKTAAAAQAAKLAKTLSAARAKAVTEELRELGFLRAGFGVRLESLAEARLQGGELAEFQFAPNPGEPAKPLRSIASSGEISRVMLALKSVLAGQEGVPLLVFDEIDANVGGEVAVKVGQKMRGLSSAHQVLCITHLPQVAAAAHRQFAVTKEYDGNRTLTAVGELVGPARVAELARMLGGQDTDSALAHARTLLASQG